MAFVPALYAWFNIVGFRDPYAHTSQIRVAVANEDEGATKDGLGTVNVGALLSNQLRQNDQLGWHFVCKMDNLFRSIRVSDENSSVTKAFHFFK